MDKYSDNIFFVAKYDDIYSGKTHRLPSAAEREISESKINCIEKRVVPIYLITAEEKKEYEELKKLRDEGFGLVAKLEKIQSIARTISAIT